MSEAQRASDGPLADELGATLGARKDLGDQYEQALVQSFLEKVDREVDARLNARLGATTTPARPRGRRRGGGSFLTLGSVALGIPVTAVVTENWHGLYGLLGVIVAWGAIVGVNVANSLGRRG